MKSQLTLAFLCPSVFGLSVLVRRALGVCLRSPTAGRESLLEAYPCALLDRYSRPKSRKSSLAVKQTALFNP